jgi:hypothetical protein
MDRRVSIAPPTWALASSGGGRACPPQGESLLLLDIRSPCTVNRDTSGPQGMSHTRPICKGRAEKVRWLSGRANFGPAPAQ